MKNRSLAQYVFTSKYAKTLEGGRPESYEQTVDRYLSTFEGLDGALRDDLREALVSKKIAGSQRGLQFGGAAIRDKNERAYNCSSSHCDRPRFFAEAFYLLLCGCGVGFSVQKMHTQYLPSIVKPFRSVSFVVGDSIEGWADAVFALVRSYMGMGALPLFDFSEIRPAGSAISHGGVAPGPEGLRVALERVQGILEARIDSELRPIDCFDMTMHLADAVLSGGIRRAATLCMFDLDDEEMLQSKTGDWFAVNPQRARANISAVILPHHTKEQFASIFDSTRQFGEPGFVNLADGNYSVNPCCEILMCPLLIKGEDGKVLERYSLGDLGRIDELRQRGLVESGWQMCNLSTINCAALAEPSELPRYARLATILGTHQASLTRFKYLGEVSEQITRREALLGVSMTGIYANKGFLDPDLLNLSASTCVLTNKFYAEELGIAPASRICCVKPEGTASITLGVVSSGLHPYHAHKYIRRVQANALEPMYQYVERVAPYACSKSVWGGSDARVIAFACSAPKGAFVKSELSVQQHIADIVSVNRNWVRHGESPNNRLESAHHNVSCTISVGESEWDLVRDLLWENIGMLTGVSMLPSTGDYIYEQAPLQEVIEGSDDPKHKEVAALWELLNSMPDLDFDGFDEHTEDFGAEPACAGGACALPMWDSTATDSTLEVATDSTLADSTPVDVSHEASATDRASLDLILEIASHLLRDNAAVLDRLKADFARLKASIVP